MDGTDHALASDAVDHARNPGTAECGRHGEYAHDHADITLAAALLHDIKREQEKRAEAGCVTEICQCHGPECRSVEHRVLTVRSGIRAILAGHMWGVKSNPQGCGARRAKIISRSLNLGITAADRGEGQIETQPRDLPGNPGGEGVAVRSGEYFVGGFPWVVLGSPVDGINQIVDPYPFVLHEDPWFFTEPVTVGNVFVDPHNRLAAMPAPADHVVDRVSRFAGAFGGDPGVNSEPATPTPGPGTVDMQDGFFCNGRVGRDPRRFTAGSAPVIAGGTINQGDSY